MELVERESLEYIHQCIQTLQTIVKRIQNRPPDHLLWDRLQVVLKVDWSQLAKCDIG